MSRSSILTTFIMRCKVTWLLVTLISVCTWDFIVYCSVCVCVWGGGIETSAAEVNTGLDLIKHLFHDFVKLENFYIRAIPRVLMLH